MGLGCAELKARSAHLRGFGRSMKTALRRCAEKHAGAWWKEAYEAEAHRVKFERVWAEGGEG